MDTELASKHASVNKKVELAVVTVNFRTPQLVVDCLATLLPDITDMNAVIVVVDNDSGDDSVPRISQWLKDNDGESRVMFIQSPHNGGFAAGNNIGINSVDADYYLLLNSDTLIRSGSIRQLCYAARKFPDAGLISPRLEWPDTTPQESCFRFPSPFSEFMLAAQTGVFDRFLKKYIVAMPVQQHIAHPDWTSFACVLIKEEVIRQLGGLDEGYFMYYEDIEFCHRLRQSGRDIVHDPEARVIHLRGGSSPVKQRTSQKKRLPAYYYESRTRFFYQKYGYPGLITANLMWSLGRMVSGARQLLGRSDKAAIEKQWLDIWKNCLNPMKPYSHPEA